MYRQLVEFFLFLPCSWVFWCCWSLWIVFVLKNRQWIFRCNKVRCTGFCFVLNLTRDLTYFLFVNMSKLILYSHVLSSDVQSFLGCPWMVEWCPCIAFFTYCGGPANFQMASANSLEVAKFQTGLFWFCRVERINPIRGAGGGFRWPIYFRTEDILFPVYFTKLLHELSFVFFRSNAVRCIQCRCWQELVGQ
jgi:hypothetical protein